MDEEAMKNAGIAGTVDLSPRDPPSVSDLTDRLHLLPCSIKHDGPSEISQYFKPRSTDVVVDGLSVKEAFFRGRKLLGVTVPVPEGYRGYVLDKKKSKKGKRADSSEGDFSQWDSRAEFGNLTYWNHDSLPSTDDPLLLCFHWFPVADADGNKWIIKPRALGIIWGGDTRYWHVPGPAKPTDPVELLQVSWLEVTGSLNLAYLEKGQDYKVSFKLRLKPDAFGWADSPVYLMAKPGKGGLYNWRKSDLSLLKHGEIISVPHNPALKFTVPEKFASGDKLLFGLYEIWKGRWKGGLVIHEVVIEPFTDD